MEKEELYTTQDKTTCQHRYESVIIKTQEWKNNHTRNYSYDYATLTQEKVKIFCIKCGDSKEI